MQSSIQSHGTFTVHFPFKKLVLVFICGLKTFTYPLGEWKTSNNTSDKKSCGIALWECHVSLHCESVMFHCKWMKICHTYLSYIIPYHLAWAKVAAEGLNEEGLNPQQCIMVGSISLVIVGFPHSHSAPLLYAFRFTVMIYNNSKYLAVEPSTMHLKLQAAKAPKLDNSLGSPLNDHPGAANPCWLIVTVYFGLVIGCQIRRLQFVSITFMSPKMAPLSISSQEAKECSIAGIKKYGLPLFSFH